MSEQNANNQPTNNNEPTVVNPTPAATPPANSNQQMIDVDALMTKVRQEEKNKLYTEIEKVKEQLSDKTTKLNDAILLVSQKDEEIAKLTKLVEDAKTEGEKNMSKTVEDLQKEIEKLNKQLADKDGEVQKVKTEYELKEYRAEKVKDVDESVLDLVSGSTKEEIDASVEKAKATYEKIASKFNTQNPNNNQNQNQNQVPPVANQIPPVNMGIINSDTFKNMSPEDLWKLDPKSPEYKKLREQLGLK